MRKLQSALVLVSLLGLSGCGTLYFKSDFNSDPLGSRPLESPPGAPTGDLVYLSDVEGRNAVIVSAGPGRAVQYRKRPDAVYQRYAGFVGAELDTGQDRFTAMWGGLADLRAGEGPLDIWLGNSHFGAIAEIRLQNGRVYHHTGNGNYTDIGALDNLAEHTVLWTINRATARHSLSILPRGGPAINLSNVPVIQGAANPYLTTTRPTLWMLFPEGASGSSTYRIDDLRIADTDRSP